MPVHLVAMLGHPLLYGAGLGATYYFGLSQMEWERRQLGSTDYQPENGPLSPLSVTLADLGAKSVDDLIETEPAQNALLGEEDLSKSGREQAGLSADRTGFGPVSDAGFRRRFQTPVSNRFQTSFRPVP